MVMYIRHCISYENNVQSMAYDKFDICVSVIPVTDEYFLFIYLYTFENNILFHFQNLWLYHWVYFNFNQMFLFCLFSRGKFTLVFHMTPWHNWKVQHNERWEWVPSVMFLFIKNIKMHLQEASGHKLMSLMWVLMSILCRTKWFHNFWYVQINPLGQLRKIILTTTKQSNEKQVQILRNIV